MSTTSEAAAFSLHFGTGGIRTLMGEGPKRLNVGTVAVATQGLADWLGAHVRDARVAIARDCRDHGSEFVACACSVLAGNGVHVVDLGVAPTPMLSFAVRALGCDAGVVITASHNARAWNGYKVYGPDGCQATTQICAEIAEAIAGVRAVRVPTDAELEELVGREDGALAQNYARALVAATPEDGTTGQALRIAYTPLNGTGYRIVPQVLADDGFDCAVVDEQAMLDGAFLTCPYPNPEDDGAMRLVADLALSEQCDLALATDPDADRVGVLVRHDGAMVRVSGDEVGELLLDWVCRVRAEAGEDLLGKVVLSTVVTSAALDALCERCGLELRRTLTGFKFVGEQIGYLESEGRADDFLLGIEESLGYLSGTYVRDKDGVQGCLLVARMARWHAARGRDLVQALEELREGMGWYLKSQVSVPFDEADDMRAVMERARQGAPKRLGGLAVRRVTDYAKGAPMPGDPAQTLPPSDVLQWDLEDHNRMIMRPSGTEPKIKIYCFACADTLGRARERLAALEQAAHSVL